MPHWTAGPPTVIVQVPVTVAAERGGPVTEMLDHGGPVTTMLDKRRKEFEKLYFEWGWSLRQVADHFIVSVWGLERWMKIRHIESRGRSEAQKLRWARRDRKGITEAIITMRLKHLMSLTQIAQKTGVSRSGVHNILVGLGLAGWIDQLPSHEEYLEGKHRGNP